MGIIIDEYNFDTITLVLALIKNNIIPVIINEKIGETIKGILENEKIDIVFYESIIRPEYLEKQKVIINETLQYFVMANPYANVKDKGKIKSLKWYLNFLQTQQQDSDCICKMYDISEHAVMENVVTKNDMEKYKKSFDELQYTRNLIITTLPLYKKQGFLCLNTALSNGMHITCLNSNYAIKNLKKILKEKPSIITFDIQMLMQLVLKKYSIGMDLSFVEKVIMDDELTASDINIACLLLKKNGFKGICVKTEDMDMEKQIIKKI